MPTQDEIERRANELYELRGREDGHDRDDWLLAEAQLRRDEAVAKSLAVRDTAGPSPRGTAAANRLRDQLLLDRLMRFELVADPVPEPPTGQMM
jgi:hypothetical protein